MSLFNSSDRDDRRRKKALEKQRKLRKKQNETAKKKQQKQKKKQTSNDKDVAMSWFAKTTSFFGGLVELFVPSKSRTRHDRLIKQGSMFLACIGCVIIGLGISTNSYIRTEISKAKASSFLTSSLSWSKTNSDIDTSVKPFMTQNRRTVYIPFRTKDMSQIDPDASNYHILMMAKDGKQLQYRVESVQLVSYGSTGLMYLQVNTAQPVTTQPVQFIIWSGSNVTNDKYDPHNDTGDAMAFVNVKKKYDTVSFSINLGGTGVKTIPEYIIKKKTEGKKVKTIKIPIQANADLYNDNKMAFIYNRMYQQKQLDSQKNKLNKARRRLTLALNRINKDSDALKRSGYDLPTLPKWATNSDNNLSDGLPIPYENTLKFSMLHPDASYDDKMQKSIEDAVESQKKATSSDSKFNSSDSSSLNDKTKEGKFISSLSGKTIKNKHNGNTLNTSASDGSNTDNDNDDDDDSSSNDTNIGGNDNIQWNELVSELQEVVALKTRIYRTIPINIWSQYQDFAQRSSFGSENNRKSNSGAITYSKIRGYNKHGRFMTIIGQPGSKKQ